MKLKLSGMTDFSSTFRERFINLRSSMLNNLGILEQARSILFAKFPTIPSNSLIQRFTPFVGDFASAAMYLSGGQHDHLLIACGL